MDKWEELLEEVMLDMAGLENAGFEAAKMKKDLEANTAELKGMIAGMLEALEEVISLLQDGYLNFDDAESETGFNIDHWRQAIAKARGEQ